MMLNIIFEQGALSQEEHSVLKKGFEEHSQSLAAPTYDKKVFSWRLLHESPEFNSQEKVGILVTHQLWDWMYIDELWVNPSFRGEGFGRLLMNQAEKKAKSDNCTGIWLWTQSWQAEHFYRKLKYELFASFPDFPKGHQRLSLRKFLNC